MKLILDGLTLSDAVIKVSKALSVKRTNPVLEGIYLKAEKDSLLLIATDTELTIEKVIPAEVLMEGETVVTGKLFAEFVKKLENEQVELSLNEDTLKIKYSDAEGKIQVFNPESFPKPDKDLKENYLVIKGGDLKKVIEKTVFSCSVDDSRPLLKAELFEVKDNYLTAVAIDGYRMAVYKKECVETSGEFKAIIPSRTLSEISRLIEKEDENVKIQLQRNVLMIESDNTTLLSRLLEGEFINYKQIIPADYLTNVRVNTKIFMQSVDRASILARSERLSIIKLDIKESAMLVSAKSEVGFLNESIVINMEGKDIAIAFNSKYLSDLLRVTDDEFININFNSPISPCVIKPFEGDEFLYLVLPVKINA